MVGPKPFAACEAEAPICGHCGRMLHGVHVRTGSTVARCGQQRCQGFNFIVAAAEETCIVYAVSLERAKRIAEDPRPAREILGELGFITRSITYRPSTPHGVNDETAVKS